MFFLIHCKRVLFYDLRGVNECSLCINPKDGVVTAKISLFISITVSSRLTSIHLVTLQIYDAIEKCDLQPVFRLMNISVSLWSHDHNSDMCMMIAVISGHMITICELPSRFPTGKVNGESWMELVWRF